MSTFDFMQWLPDDAREAVTRHATIRHVPARSTIYSQSEPGDEMFRIRAGLVRLSVMQSDGRELFYQLFGPGDCFGTSSVVDRETRPQTAEAYEDVELQVFSRAMLDELRAKFPIINDALLRLLSRHMRLLSDYFAGFAFDELSCRLAQRLVDMIDTFGVDADGGVMLSIPISQTELATMVGNTRQSVNRALQSFKEAGLLTTVGSRLLVTDLPRLRGVAEQGWRLRSFGRDRDRRRATFADREAKQ